MTEQEIRRALARADELSVFPVSQDEVSQFRFLAVDERTGYAATLRALLEALELLQDETLSHNRRALDKPFRHQGDSFPTQIPCDCGWCAKVRAFLAEGESA